MMSLVVWLPGFMFLRGISVPGPMFLLGVSIQGGLCPRGSLSKSGSLSKGGLPPGIRKAGSMHLTGILSCFVSIFELHDLDNELHCLDHHIAA